MNRKTKEQIAEALFDLNREYQKRNEGFTTWKIQQKRLQKSVSFDDFKQAFAFMSELAGYAEEVNHHPEWTNVYNRVDIRLYTHDLDGLSELDFRFAKEVEDLLLRQDWLSK